MDIGFWCFSNTIRMSDIGQAIGIQPFRPLTGLDKNIRENRLSNKKSGETPKERIQNMNVNNFGIAKGRLGKEPVIFTNSDGSKKVLISVAVKNNYKNKAGERESQFIALEGFISKDKTSNGAYDFMHTGDLVSFAYEVRQNNYTDKDGKAVYSQVLFIQEITLEESKKATEDRAAARAKAVEEDAAEV